MTEDEDKRELSIRFIKSDIYRNFHSLLFEPSANDFVDLQKEVDEVYSEFTSRLRNLYPRIKPLELRLCLLVKIGLSPNEISIYLGCSSSAVSMMRRRLYNKIFGVEVKPEVFDEFICSF